MLSVIEVKAAEKAEVGAPHHASLFPGSHHRGGLGVASHGGETSAADHARHKDCANAAGCVDGCFLLRFDSRHVSFQKNLYFLVPWWASKPIENSSDSKWLKTCLLTCHLSNVLSFATHDTSSAGAGACRLRRWRDEGWRTDVPVEELQVGLGGFLIFFVLLIYSSFFSKPRKSPGRIF